jgi:hypothetical protein
MKLRVLIAGALALAVVLIPAEADAKGVTTATISGPGLRAPIRLGQIATSSDPNAASPLTALANKSGLYATIFAQRPDPLTTIRPAGPLGSRYVAVYHFDAPAQPQATIRQDLYPFASGGPLSYTPPGQRIFRTQTSHRGWYHASTDLKDLLVSAGVPTPQSSAGLSSRCRNVTPRAQTAAQAVPGLVNQGRYSGQPDLGPQDVVIGHSALWVQGNRAVATPTFDVYTGLWNVSKVPWFRAKPGTLTITGRRLDGPGRFSAWIPPPGSYPDTGFLPTGFTFSTGGCWQVTAHLRDSTVKLTYNFSSSAQVVCTQLRAQLRQVAPYLTVRDGSYPHNLAYSQTLQAAIQTRHC